MLHQWNDAMKSSLAVDRSNFWNTRILFHIKTGDHSRRLHYI